MNGNKISSWEGIQRGHLYGMNHILYIAAQSSIYNTVANNSHSSLSLLKNFNMEGVLSWCLPQETSEGVFSMSPLQETAAGGRPSLFVTSFSISPRILPDKVNYSYLDTSFLVTPLQETADGGKSSLLVTGVFPMPLTTHYEN